MPDLALRNVDKRGRLQVSAAFVAVVDAVVVSVVSAFECCSCFDQSGLGLPWMFRAPR